MSTSPPRLIDGRDLGRESTFPLRPHTTPRYTLSGQPLVRIVGPETEAIFGSRREHAIGLGHAARHEIIDHDADVGVGAGERYGVPAAGPAGRIQARHETLSGRFLVARRSVDLPGQEQPGEALGFEAGLQFAGSTKSYSIA